MELFATTTAAVPAAAKTTSVGDWPIPISKRAGRELLRNVRIWYDFDWYEVMGHNRTVFPRCKCFAQGVSDDCPDDKIPVLFLTSRTEVTMTVEEDHRYRIVVANVHLVLKSESYTHFLNKAAKRPLSDLVANEELLAAAMVEVERDPSFRERIEQLIDTHSGNSRAKLQRAIRLIEACEDITDEEVTALLTVLQKFKGSTEPLDETLDKLAEVTDIVHWIQADPERRRKLNEALGPEPTAPPPTASQIAETIQSLPVVACDDALAVIRAMRCDEGVRKYLAENMALIGELARNEYRESDLVAVKYRREQLVVFQRLLSDPGFFSAAKAGERGPEAVWQKFFEKNPWIFGYGLHYLYVSNLDDKKLEQITTGFQVGQVGKRTDALMKTQGLLSSLCFCEIKTQQTKLMANAAYRSGCWSISDELAGSVAQVQQTVARFLMREKRKIESKDAEGNPTDEELWFYAPRSFVVIGQLSEFQVDNGTNEDKFSSFQIFRDELRRPEIITFDELYERARHIVEFGETESLHDAKSEPQLTQESVQAAS